MFEEVNENEMDDRRLSAMKQLLQILNDLETGTVTVTVKEGRIRHIEKSEKLRLC